MTTDQNSLESQVGALVRADSKSGMDVQSARAVAEVQGAMTIAKKFPRDEDEAFKRIMKSCSRIALAEVALYEYPRGGQKVTGPSIRLAEALAQGWGNLDTGVVELERRHGESTAMAYCVDLETNYRKTVVFTVPHVRDTKNGSKDLTDTRDIYETVMNNGARRLRNAILAVIPGDIVDAALEKSAETVRKGSAKPLQDRIREMLSVMSDFGVSSEMIEKLFQCKTSALSETNMVRLRGIYQSLRDGIASAGQFFDVKPESAAAELSKMVGIGAIVNPAGELSSGGTSAANPKPSTPTTASPAKPATTSPASSSKGVPSTGSFSDEQPTSLFTPDPRVVK